MHEQIQTTHDRPITYFSNLRDGFHKVRALSLQNNLSCCLENVIVRVLVSSGAGHVQVNGMLFPLRKGSLCLFDIMHCFEFISDESAPLEVEYLCIDASYEEYLSFEMDRERKFRQALSRPVVALSGGDRHAYLSLWKRFAAEGENPSAASYIIQMGLLGQMKDLESRLQKREKGFTANSAWKAFAFLCVHCEDNPSTSAVAKAMELSPPALNRLLRKITTYNYSALLSRAKVIAAGAVILYSRELLLSRISYGLHFISENAFYKTFVKWYGVTPQQYRNTFARDIYGYQRSGPQRNEFRLIIYIQDHFLEPLTLQELSAEMQLSESKINELLRQAVGKTLQRYLTNLRIRYAQNLLQSNTMAICDIAFDSGFASISTFCRVFKKEVGMTASAYRTLYQADEGMVVLP